MTVRNRIEKLIEKLGISKAEFERRVGWGTSYASKIVDSVSIDKLECIKVVFPNVNLSWIQTGEGEMFSDEQFEPEPTKSKLFADIVKSLKDKNIITSQRDLALKLGIDSSTLSLMFNGKRNISEKFYEELFLLDSDIDIEELKKKVRGFDATGNYFELSKGKTKIAPVIPPDATGDVMSYISSNKEDIIYVEPSQMYPFYDAIFRVPSSAMSPCIEKGDIIYLKKLPVTSILNGNVYLINTENHGLILRLVYHEDKDIFKCVSLSKAIPTVSISLNNIKHIFDVVGMFKFDVPLHKFNLMSSEYNDKQELLKIALSQNNQLITELKENGRRIDLLIDMLAKSLQDK